MEKEWENFWVTGHVSDYLSYKNHYQEETEEQNVHGTIDYRDRDGDKHHAHIGL